MVLQLVHFPQHFPCSVNHHPSIFMSQGWALGSWGRWVIPLPQAMYQLPVENHGAQGCDITAKGLILVSSIIDTTKWLMMDCWWLVGGFKHALLRSYLRQWSPIWPTYWLEWFQSHEQLSFVGFITYLKTAAIMWCHGFHINETDQPMCNVGSPNVKHH